MRFSRLDEGWLNLLLLAGVLLSPVIAVVAADWVDGLSILHWVVLAALACGALCARIPLRQWVVHPASLLIGTGCIGYGASTTLPKVEDDRLVERLLVVADRFGEWLDIAQRGGTSTDPMMFLLVLAALSWLVAYTGAWSVVRWHELWWPLCAAGAALVVNASYAPELAAYAIPFVLSAVVLVARLNLLRREQTWQGRGATYDAALPRTAFRLGLPVSAAIVLGSWLMPGLSTQESYTQFLARLSGPWDEVVHTTGRLFAGGIRGRIPVRSSDFGHDLIFRGNVQLGDLPIARVWADEPVYLRAIAYDRYAGWGWQASEYSYYKVADPDEVPLAVKYELTEEVKQTVEILSPRGRMVLAAGEPTWIGRSVETRVLTPLENVAPSSYHWQFDVIALEVSLSEGDLYDVVSSVSRADGRSLRAAGEDYPIEVISRYLSLPEVPPEVEELAVTIVEPYTNPYDRALAIERYVRRFPYDLGIPPPPPGRDGVAYFLFDVQQGYCDYYASAMAVMLRVVGVPARVVSGYAPGTLDDSGSVFTVTQRNAHSWVEVFFPNYGWIPFEPTGYMPRQDHQRGDLDLDQLAGLDSEYWDWWEDDDWLMDWEVAIPQSPSQPGSNPLSPGWLTTMAIALAGVALSLLGINFLWQIGLAGLPPAQGVYARVTRLSALCGWPSRAAETPHEYAARLGRRLADERAPLQLVTDAYVAHRFGRREPSVTQEAALSRAWREIRKGLVRARLSSLAYLFGRVRSAMSRILRRS